MARLTRLDMLFVHETHIDLSNQVDWNKEWSGRVFFDHETTLSAEVGILFSKTFSPESVKVETVIQGRPLLVTAIFEHFTVFFFIFMLLTLEQKEFVSFIL